MPIYTPAEQATDRALSAVARERRRQDELYGSQRHLPPDRWLAVIAREFCEAGNEANEHFKGRATSNEKLRTELVQIAAVAVAWVEALDAAPATPERVLCTCCHHIDWACPTHGHDLRP